MNVVAAPVGFVKEVGDRLEKDPDRRVQAAIGLVIDKIAELGNVRRTLLWFLELQARPADQTQGRRGRLASTAVFDHPWIIANPAYGGAYATARQAWRCI